MKPIYLVVFFFVIFFFEKYHAQQNVLITDNTATVPHASSLMELNSTTKGFLMPRVALSSTTSQSPIGVTPLTSLLVYNIATAGDVTPGFYYWDGTKWNRFDSGNNIGDWKLLGNASTNASSNYLGTSDNVDLVFRTNGIERIRTLGSNGKVGIGTSTPSMRLDVTDASTTTSDATIRGAATGSAATFGVLGTSTSVTGQGVFGFNSNASGTGVIGAGNNLPAQYLALGSGGAFTSSNVGVYGYGNNTASSYGMFGQSVNATGIGVLGQASSSTGFNVGVYGISSSPAGDGINAINNVAAGTGDGNGIYGTTAQTTGFGVWGTNSNSIGTGVVGSGNGVISQYLINGSGGAFTGSTTGVFAYNTSLGVSQAIYSNNGGVIGRVNYWNGATQYKILGPGTVSTVANGLSGNKVVLHAPETPEIYFQDYGNGQLINGKAHVDLDPIFTKNITVNENHPLQVFIQLNGDCKGVFVTNRQSDGFDVIELQSGNSNVEFTWSVTANRADEVLSNGRISKYTDIRFEKAPYPINDGIKQLKVETARDKLIIINSTLKPENKN